jgi:hypothetical protein
MTVNDINKCISLMKGKANDELRFAMSAFAMSELGLLLFPSDAASFCDNMINRERGFNAVVNAGLLDLQSQLRAGPVPSPIPTLPDFSMAMVPSSVAAVGPSDSTSCGGRSGSVVSEEAAAKALEERRRKGREKKARQRERKRKERERQDEAKDEEDAVAVGELGIGEQMGEDQADRDRAAAREKARLKKQRQRKRNRTEEDAR